MTTASNSRYSITDPHVPVGDSVTEDYQAQTAALAASTAVGALAVCAAYRAGDLSVPEAGVVIGTAVATANAVATALADAYVAAHIEQATGVPTPAIGLPPTDHTERLTGAVRVILSDAATDVPEGTQSDESAPDPAAMRIERLAHSEPLAAAQQATVAVVAAQPAVVGWRRQMDADPCELCRFWYSGGRIYRTTTAFQSHPGCNCQPEPVYRKELIA